MKRFDLYRESSNVLVCSTVDSGDRDCRHPINSGTSCEITGQVDFYGLDSGGRVNRQIVDLNGHS
jgi:hypothetical protein